MTKTLKKLKPNKDLVNALYSETWQHRKKVQESNSNENIIKAAAAQKTFLK